MKTVLCKCGGLTLDCTSHPPSCSHLLLNRRGDKMKLLTGQDTKPGRSLTSYSPEQNGLDLGKLLECIASSNRHGRSETKTKLNHHLTLPFFPGSTSLLHFQLLHLPVPSSREGMGNRAPRCSSLLRTFSPCSSPSPPQEITAP